MKKHQKKERPHQLLKSDIGAAQICLCGRTFSWRIHAIAYPGYLYRLAESHMVGKEKHYMWGVAWIWTQDVVVWWEILDWAIIFLVEEWG